jgi:hypothetical protein
VIAVLLGLPYTYFTRIKRTLEHAEPEAGPTRRMPRARTEGRLLEIRPKAPKTPQATLEFQEAWQDFIESLLKEWKLMNVVSALLIT